MWAVLRDTAVGLLAEIHSLQNEAKMSIIIAIVFMGLLELGKCAGGEGLCTQCERSETEAVNVSNYHYPLIVFPPLFYPHHTHTHSYTLTGRSQYLTNTVHKTSAATEKINDLWCYSCNATDDGEACIDLSSGNNASFVKKCNPEEFICMVSDVAALLDVASMHDFDYDSR